MKITVDLNCDMGESFGAYTIGNDGELVKHVTSSNVACGAHASDPTVMRRTVELCKRHNVMVGAHPGYPDLAGFGRRFLDMEHGTIIDTVIYQIGALKGFADLLGMELQHVKLHGALYHYTMREEALFLDIVKQVRGAFGDVIFLTGASVSAELRLRCRDLGARIALEVFPDRAYSDDGALLARTAPGAVIGSADTIAARAIAMVKDRGVQSANGKWIDLHIDTLCLHGDNTESLLAAPMIRRTAALEGISVMPLGRFV